MELRDIAVFLVLAEELHFGRTAQRLHLSQGRVSQLIRALEREVGGPLFERSSREVRLTQLGRRFQEGAEIIHNEAGDTLRACRTLASGTGRRLHVGYSSAIGLAFVAELLGAFESAHPGSTVVFNSRGVVAANPLESLMLDDTMDLALMWCPGGGGHHLSSPGLTVGAVIEEDPRAVLVPAGDPLAGRDSIGLDDLVGRRLLDPGLPAASAFREAWAPQVTPTGRRLDYTAEDLAGLIGRSEVEITDVYPLVLAGKGLHFTVASVLDRVPCPGLVAVRIAGMPPGVLVPVWRTSTEDDGIRAFVDVARSLRRGEGRG
ncbi:LysR family transcriptional regulator [Pseudonocardia sp. TRM90224]|uniref:LysR family transcriptional regulator n=1 Tax=Pseudonocardia sp. TRM90224 TaxID=2812678 RepID=UPI001E3577A5|nr:LysR family transcriptional regulator [Pseudonocardia sp. TRM90224]